MTYENTLFEFANNQGNYKFYGEVDLIKNDEVEKELRRTIHTMDPRMKAFVRRSGIIENINSITMKNKLKQLIEECYAEILLENSEMVKNDLHKIIDYSEKLQSMIDKDSDMEDWVKAKLTHAADYIDTVFDYLRFYERDEVRHVMDEKWSNKYKKSIKKIMIFVENFCIEKKKRHKQYLLSGFQLHFLFF